MLDHALTMLMLYLTKHIMFCFFYEKQEKIQHNASLTLTTSVRGLSKDKLNKELGSDFYLSYSFLNPEKRNSEI